jgi:hypothetical protein
MSQNITVLVDDQDSRINYLCPSLKQDVAGSYSNNTWTTIQSADCSNGWFEYVFYGTGVHIAASVAHPTQDVSVKLDDGHFIPQPGNGHYDSPVLADGRHTVTYAIGNVSLVPVFDYLTVDAGPSTPLSGSTLIVDDSDTTIKYSGSWTTSPPHPLSFDYSTSLYKNTTHWSSTVGDTIEFKFTGTSVSVYGLFSNISAGGNISATYSIDGNSTTQFVPQGSLDSVPMAQLFHADLQAGNHTLSVNVTSITSPRALGVDFIAYNSSVTSVAALPGYTQSPIQTASTNHHSSASSSIHAWIITAIVLGVVLVLGLGLGGVLFARRRARRTEEKGLGRGLEF